MDLHGVWTTPAFVRTWLPSDPAGPDDAAFPVPSATWPDAQPHVSSMESPVDDTFALILAGGSGTRFWPLSRNDRPKQLLPLFGDRTLLEQAVERLDGLVPKANILVLTNRVQEEQTRALLPDIPPENILPEPEKRDTAPAIALGVGAVARRNPSARMIVLPADQLIRDTAAFRNVMRGSLELASRTDGLVTVGIRPTWACPSYGYIERGSRVSVTGVPDDIVAYEVKRFREKPNPELADQFLQSGRFTWNAGMFIWTLPTVVSQMSLHCPELSEFVAEIRRASDMRATLASQFGRLTPISIDYALMERASRVINVEATFDWDDVGSWISVGKYLEHDAAGNSANCALTGMEASNNIVFSREGAHVALLGVEDLVVVQTADAVLIAHRSQADKIKKLVDHLPTELL